MNKTYEYQRPYYQIEVVLVGAFCVLICVACLVSLVIDTFIPRGIAVVFAAASLYQVWNTFISLSNPGVVRVDDDEITFEGFGRRHAYRLSELKEFRVRPFPSSGKTYIRVNNHGLMRGRYWVPTKMFTDGKELFDYLDDLEYRVHPDSLKARARNVNQKYIDRADDLARVKQLERDAQQVRLVSRLPGPLRSRAEKNLDAGKRLRGEMPANATTKTMKAARRRKPAPSVSSTAAQGNRKAK